MQNIDFDQKFFTESGWLRIRWWLPFLGVVYTGLGLVSVLMVIFGAEGHADPVWHAPLFWLQALVS